MGKHLAGKHASIDTAMPMEDIAYMYLLITIGDNDFYITFSTMGEATVKTLGDYIVSDTFDEPRFRQSLPEMVAAFAGICQNGLRMDYIVKHLKVYTTLDGIRGHLQAYGMDGGDDYENEIFKGCKELEPVMHMYDNAESLILKLAYDKKDRTYLEAYSDWAVI